ncbi:hypothetical protein [Mucilaginibacter gotjawali]|uniref:Uncharacterized protein n=2 Tax=Mucilaginibacter gotjawali TaxID=1550579 RepID=A0A839SI42_9SPHI|nr:hypothetical protein [Mucilaginibacter gotjawali]MBB3056963.1 hypothetical protein [Mucilaginibacter gotjawali]BAU56042.1 hypothetical protein MgSA37_04234 [Mucilaginibacter gotjawali]
MVINKKIALALVVANVIFLIYSVFLFFYFGHTIFPDFTKPQATEPSADSIWNIIATFLNIVVYIGLFWVLGAFKEHILIRGAMLLLLFLKVPAIISLNFNHLDAIAMSALFQSIIVFFACLAVAMLIVLLFVRSKMIKLYFRWFVALMLVALILPTIGDYVYDNFSVRWLLIDRFLLVWASFMPTLFLFIKVYSLSKQNDFVVHE